MVVICKLDDELRDIVADVLGSRSAMHGREVSTVSATQEDTHGENLHDPHCVDHMAAEVDGDVAPVLVGKEVPVTVTIEKLHVPSSKGATSRISMGALLDDTSMAPVLVLEELAPSSTLCDTHMAFTSWTRHIVL